MVMTMKKIQAYAFLPNLRRKIAIRDTAREKSERLKVDKKTKKT